MKFLEEIVKVNGYENSAHFVKSSFHPETFIVSAGISSVFASIAYYFETIFGIVLPVGILVIILFGLEMFTGIRASRKEGIGFSSAKFQKGWLKLFIYFIFIACTNTAAVYIKVRPLFGISFNIYDWLHYAFYNYIIIQFLISNLENFVRLGWDDFSPILKKLTFAIGIRKQEKK